MQKDKVTVGEDKKGAASFTECDFQLSPNLMRVSNRIQLVGNYSLLNSSFFSTD
jgi:hypothetical protein